MRATADQLREVLPRILEANKDQFARAMKAGRAFVVMGDGDTANGKYLVADGPVEDLASDVVDAIHSIRERGDRHPVVVQGSDRTLVFPVCRRG